MFGPGRTPLLPEVLVVHGVFFLEALSNGEDILILLLFDMNVVESILQEPNFLPFILKVLGNSALPFFWFLGCLFLQVIGFDEDQQSVLQFLYISFEPLILFLYFLVKNRVSELCLRYVPPFNFLSQLLGLCL